MAELTQHHRSFCKDLQSLTGRHHPFDLFRDFCEMAAISLANHCDLRQPLRQNREDRYMAIVKRYKRDEVNTLAGLLNHVICGMEAQPTDFLGEVFGELEMGNSAKGQFFTPFDVSLLMAQMNVGDSLEVLRRQRFIRLQEPSAGSGGMVLAYAQAMREAGYNPQQQLHVVAIDVDPRAVHMAYIQLALAGIPAVIYLGNTLTLEMHEEWKTPFHIMWGWDAKLRQGPEPIQTISDTTELAQVDLFAEVAA